LDKIIGIEDLDKEERFITKKTEINKTKNNLD